ncbi:MAG: MBL fold metallo-hydrolase [Granulosicoccus sp.]|nr:MBL fold metallo-hydrolase [Granulosicoccus sp.]
MTSPIPFNREHDVRYGELETLTPSLRRMTANNPSAFTFRGTGTYIVGKGEVAVIDPGPALQDHVDALVASLGGETITHILVTHTHVDHSPACALLQQVVDAPTYALGPHGMGRLPDNLAADEGGDFAFRPDVTLVDGQFVEGKDWRLECIHTPGHTSNHLCFGDNDNKALFSGDHVMGWSTSIVSPPDGNMGDYMRSLQRLLARDDDVYWPCHGGPIYRPQEFVRAFIAHREAREQQVLECLRDGPKTIQTMLPTIYPDLAPALYPAAHRSILATINYLVEKGEVCAHSEIQANAQYRLAV